MRNTISRNDRNVSINELIYAHLRNVNNLNQNIVDSHNLLRELIQLERYNSNIPATNSHSYLDGIINQLLMSNVGSERRRRRTNDNNYTNENDNNRNIPVSDNNNLNQNQDAINNTENILNGLFSSNTNNNNNLMNQIFSQASNVRTSTNGNNQYVLSFDTFIPNFLPPQQERTEDFSYNIQHLTAGNVHMLSSLKETSELLDVETYDLLENPVNDICPITRERLNHNQNVLMICRCGHVYNKSSLKRWILTHNTCPSCRTIIHRRENSD